MNSRNRKSKGNKPPFSVYLAATIVVFFCTLSAADSVGFVPCQIDGTCTVAADSVALSQLPELGVGADATSTKGVLPARIAIPAINLDLPVQNPSTRDVATLDALLQEGPARYVDSAKLDTAGNMLIFAHSSHLPIVHNKMFQAFNNIPELKAGDTIEVTGEDGSQFLYSVDGVARADTNDGTTIDLSKAEGTKLTLVTCDTLTGKSARFILTASFVGKVGQ